MKDEHRSKSKQFIENFINKNKKDPVKTIYVDKFQKSYFFRFVYLPYSSFPYIYLFLAQFVIFRNIKMPKSHIFSKESIFYICFFYFYLPLCVLFSYKHYLRNYYEDAFYNSIMKIENSNHLINFYRYHINKIYPNSKFFINKSNIILCRYLNKNIY